MFCRYCGSKIEDGDLYCSECGKRVDVLNENNKTIVENRAIIPRNNEKTNIMNQRSKKTLKLMFILVLVIIIIIATIIPLINIHKNSVIDSQLDSVNNSNSYFVESVVLSSPSQVIINFSDSLDWAFLDGKKVVSDLYIMESGAVIDFDKNGVYELAKGYDGYYPGSSYSAGSKQEREEIYGDDGYYCLCVASSSLDKIHRENVYNFDDYDYEITFNENRIYNFSIELNNTSDNRVFLYDSYFRYNDGVFTKVTQEDLMPEDTYFAWKDNELHFAQFCQYDTNGTPVFNLSVETYDTRE